MSILQTVTQDVSATFKTLVAQKPGAVEWPAYAKACHQISGRQTDDQALNRKRSHALRYLQDRARSDGEAYSKAASRVFTPQFVSKLGEANSAWRATHNPKLNTNIGKLSTGNGNVLPFGPQITTAGNESGASAPA